MVPLPRISWGILVGTWFERKQVMLKLWQPGCLEGCGDIVRESPSALPTAHSTGEALSVSQTQQSWAPCQTFSLSAPCPDANKFLWSVPPSPNAPSLMTGGECEVQSASALDCHSGGHQGTLGDTGGHRGTPSLPSMSTLP